MSFTFRNFLLGTLLGVLFLFLFFAYQANAIVLEYDNLTGEIDKTISDTNIYGTRILQNEVQLAIYYEWVDNYAFDDIGLNYDIKNNKVRVYSGQHYADDGMGTWFTIRYATTSLSEYFNATTKEIGWLKYIFPYANAQSVSTTTMAGDGIVKYNDALAWATVYNATNGTAVDYTTGDTASLHYCFRADSKYFTTAIFLPFGTHFLDADYPDMEIATASVFIKHFTETTDEGSDGIDMYLTTTTQATYLSLTTDDIEERGFKSPISSGVNVDGGAGWYEFPVNDTSTIAVDDFTYYGLSDECMINNSAPASSYYRDGWSFSESYGNEPYLEIGLYDSEEEEEEATTTEATPGSVPIFNDITIISGYIEHYTDSTSTPSETEYIVYHIPFFFWLVIWFVFSFVLGRMVLEIIIRLRK